MRQAGNNDIKVLRFLPLSCFGAGGNFGKLATWLRAAAVTCLPISPTHLIMEGEVVYPKYPLNYDYLILVRVTV